MNSKNCSVCGAGHYLVNAGMSGNTGCLPCPAGEYSMTIASTACTACPMGEFWLSLHFMNIKYQTELVNMRTKKMNSRKEQYRYRCTQSQPIVFSTKCNFQFFLLFNAIFFILRNIFIARFCLLQSLWWRYVKCQSSLCSLFSFFPSMFSVGKGFFESLFLYSYLWSDVNKKTRMKGRKKERKEERKEERKKERKKEEEGGRGEGSTA